MRLSDLISMGGRYLLLGGILAFIVLSIVLLVNRLLFKGAKKLKKTSLLWWVLFICYIVVILGATLLERGDFWTNTKIMPLFYSYKEAWVSGLAVDWRNIILNICMFMPFGFLLPLGFKYCKSFWITSLAGFLFTVIIEGTQLYFHLGMFELDDLMNNTVGTMIGFGLYMLYANLILKREISLKCVVLAQIPLIVSLIAFTSAFTVYHMQELGNLPYACIIPFEEETLSVSSETIFAEEAGMAAVYKSSALTKKEATKFAEDFFARLGTSIDVSQTDYYDETAVFYDRDRNYSLWIDYTGGTYQFTDFDTAFNKALTSKMNATEEEVRKALEIYGITIPSTIHMQIIEESSNYKFDYENYQIESCFLDGSIVIEYMGDGSIAGIRNTVVTNDFYKEFPIISEQKAYEMIQQGKFNYQMLDSLEININTCELTYMMDSKDFYQPVYQFSCEINGRDAILGIPAIK